MCKHAIIMLLCCPLLLAFPPATALAQEKRQVCTESAQARDEQDAVNLYTRCLATEKLSKEDLAIT